jgi:hypothetical protein
VGSVTNLATYSEDLTDADWVKSSLTVTGNAVIAPDGSMSADKLTESNGASYRKVLQNFGATLNATMHTFSIQVKSAGRDWVVLRSDNLSVGSYFNISTGTLGTDTTGNGASITSMGNGWYECSISIIMDGVSDRPALYIAAGNENGNYQGDGVSGIYAWGAQVTESLKVLPYVKTLASAVTQTFTETLRVEYDAATGKNLGALIEGGSTNLALYSEDFSKTAWSKAETSVLSNTAIAPDGTFSADTLIPNTSGNSTTAGNATTDNRLFQQSASISTSTDITNSVYVKSVSGSSSLLSIYIQVGDSIKGITTVTVTNDWQRVDVSGVISTGLLRLTICTEESVYIWGGQSEILPFATSYIRTEGSAVSRSGDSLNLPVTSIPAPSLEQTIVANFDIYGRLLNDRIYEIGGVASGRRHIYIPTSGTEIGYRYQNTSTTTQLLDDKVFKTVSSFDGTSVKFYSNKELALSMSPTELGNSSTLFKIGAATDGASPMYGHMSKFKTYAQALTAQEITLL